MTDMVIDRDAIERIIAVTVMHYPSADAVRRVDDSDLQSLNEGTSALLALINGSAKALAEVATQVGLELGRQEAAEEIAQTIEATCVPSTEDNSWLLHAARIAREVATRTADARTDPSGHTDLPPTPDALSNRLPEETGKGDS